jgi:hypothetical protein
MTRPASNCCKAYQHYLSKIIGVCAVNGLYEQRIVLAGRNKLAPVHIWTEVKYNGKWYALDLTQPYINSVREYKFQQRLYI